MDLTSNAMKRQILFLAANPDNATRLALDEECREISEKIRATDHRDSLALVTRWAVRPDDLLQHLNEHRPHVVHFSGHGSADEKIILLDKDRNAKPVSEPALRHLFATLKDNIRVVVLNACFSRSQATAITDSVDCAIGMKRAIGDKAAITFAASFYRAIGFGHSVRAAFEQGRTALMLEGIPEQDTPELISRAGVDPNQVFLLGPKTEVVTTIEFTLERPLASFDPDEFKAALHSVTGVDVSGVRITSIRPGSTKVTITGDQVLLQEILERLGKSQHALHELASATGLRRVAWRVGDSQYELTVSQSKEAPPLRKSVSVFISYSHNDEKLREKLEKHLSLLRNQGVIDQWHDRKITAGKEWDDEIDKHLDASEVILLLVSADFLASPYCNSVEVSRALERQEKGDALVIPVILRPVDWHTSPFAKLQALPRDGRPITKWANRDDAFLDVAKGIRKAVQKLPNP